MAKETGDLTLNPLNPSEPLRQRLGSDQARQPAMLAAGRWLNRGVGAMFLALGLRLALDDPLR